MSHSISYRRMLTRMGYYNYQKGLIIHHVNQEGGWENHLARCRSLIIRALDMYKPEMVTVLGSGWLLDLPLAELIERTAKVRLIDIIHPPDVASQVSKYKNVELLEQDVSGGLIEEVWQKTRRHSFFRKLSSLKTICVKDYDPGDDPGMVISLNILTQLESLPIDYLKKRSKISEVELTHFKSTIQKKHIDFLNKHNSVLITDYEEVITSKSGSTRTLTTLLTGLPQARFSEEWTWNFDQTGADLYNSRSQFMIKGLII